MLEALLAAGAPSGPGNGDLKPVGWYHSHTRSEIFLSDADLEIHRRFFPEPWQVALVLKPHTFQPMRAGFFFRETGGAIAAARSRAEFEIEPLPMERVPGAEETEERPLVAPLEKRPRLGDDAGPVITVTPEPQGAATATAPAPEENRPPAPEIAPPKFLEPVPVRSRRWLSAVLAVAAGMAIGGMLYQTRAKWLPPLVNITHSSAAPLPPAAPPAALGLSASDDNGQLQIRWERNSPAVRNAVAAVIEILDTGPPKVIALDQAHLQSGSFTYARAGESVDITLEVRQPDGRKVKEATNFLGAAPTLGLAKERDDLARQNAQLQLDIEKLQKSLAEARAQVRAQQKRRLENQDTQP